MLKKYMIEIGYTKEEIDIIINTYPICTLKEDTLLKNIKEVYIFLLSLGYTKEEVIKMTKVLPQMYGLSIENIKQKIEDIMSLGYTREEVIKMTKVLPQMYGLSIDNIKQKIEDMVSLGYTKEEVIKMTKGLPTIYGYSVENMKQKIEYYDSIGLHEMPVIIPKYLMQSVNLSYARYKFLKGRNIIIDINNYSKLFYSAKIFQRQYGISKQELLEKYNYEEYLEENKTCKYQYQY